KAGTKKGRKSPDFVPKTLQKAAILQTKVPFAGMNGQFEALYPMREPPQLFRPLGRHNRVVSHKAHDSPPQALADERLNPRVVRPCFLRLRFRCLPPPLSARIHDAS